MLAQFLYYSTACIAYKSSGNLDVLASARRHNIHNQITGFLFRTEDHFVQLLEGHHDVAVETMGRIRRDVRHTDMVVLPVMLTKQRSFSSWLMGYADAVNPKAFSPILGPEQDNFSLEDKRAHFIRLTRPYISPDQRRPIAANWGQFYDLPG
ncbi:BLUF domain-containing protein [Pacificoceanicola onchidii]|uniref:BLUF domain-containing protein n=1 Tax=Pacificoceanicola onchidii TaxID=2562685 RepID=UPI001455E5CC|nr:BLUF domain-containing protein [Pacificoceanicola onchidii]